MRTQPKLSTQKFILIIDTRLEGGPTKNNAELNNAALQSACTTACQYSVTMNPTIRWASRPDYVTDWGRPPVTFLQSRTSILSYSSRDVANSKQKSVGSNYMRDCAKYVEISLHPDTGRNIVESTALFVSIYPWRDNPMALEFLNGALNFLYGQVLAILLAIRIHISAHGNKQETISSGTHLLL